MMMIMMMIMIEKEKNQMIYSFLLHQSINKNQQCINNNINRKILQRFNFNNTGSHGTSVAAQYIINNNINGLRYILIKGANINEVYNYNILQR